MPETDGRSPLEDPSSVGGADMRIGFPRPLYVVACPVTSDPTDPYEPIVRESWPGVDDATTSFDAELVPILPAIWYALHLPKTRFDVLDLPYLGIRESLSERRRHQILLVPAALLQDRALLEAIARDGEPMLILCTDENLDAAVAASTAMGSALPPVSVTELTQGTLEAHWKAMSDHWSAGWPAGLDLEPAVPEWTPDVSLQGSTLSNRRLKRSLGGAQIAQGTEGAGDGLFGVLRHRAWVEAWAGMEERDVKPEDVKSQIEDALTVAWRRLRIPLTLSLPGVAPRYRRFVREHISDRSKNSEDEASGGISQGSAAASAVVTQPSDPPEVLSLMVAHQAAGDDSMGMVLTDSIPDAAFIALADLERYWVEAGQCKGVQPKKEARLRERLDASMESLWTEQMVKAVHSASRIDAFTNFPIGLLRIPGHTAPLAALRPIAYRPINPLTRALQVEFAPDRPVDLSRGMRVLVVECIPDTDPVGKTSRAGWSFAATELTDASRAVTVVLVDVSNKQQLAAAVASHHPDVLVISAHGFYEPDDNVAGLMIGTEPSIGDDLGPMPPMVILSACHSGPRGAGPVSVSDLLLRAGASAVLSTLVPVRVHHNSTFMVRFLHYMSEAIGGVEDHASVLDLWHRVQTNTVIVDVLYGNPKLMAWGHSDAKGEPPVVDFMARRSNGRIRHEHLYADTEAVLLEIAADRGEEAAVREWLRSPGYVPESMMYTFVGDPSRIHLQAPRLVAPGALFERGV